MNDLRWMRSALDALAEAVGEIPLSAAEGIFIGIYAVLALWVLTLPRSAAQRDPERPRPLGDLRLWALAVIGLQIAIYLWL